MKRLDYVAFDEEARAVHDALRGNFEQLIAQVEATTEPGRSRSLAITKLEEAYMWVGKAVRDDQVAKRGGA